MNISTYSTVGCEPINAFIGAVQNGDAEAALACLADRFGIHDGLDRNAYVAHEIQEFGRRKALLNGALKVKLLAQSGDCRHIVIEDAGGHLVYEDWIHVNEDGLIVGNGYLVEMVPKLRFHANGAVSRGMSLRVREGRLGHAHVVTPFAHYYRFEQRSSSQEPDEASHLSFVLDEDDLLGKEGVFRLYIEAEGGLRAVDQSCYLRGTDHPYFRGNLHPVIHGPMVSFSQEMVNAWAVTVELESGRFVTIAAPSAGTIDFGEPVRNVVLTDALDNDWDGIHAG